ncbi:MAG: glycosyltransferase family 2 protein [Bacteroidales bacterium]|jgi:glycosyltransferase involved in cell wall biosynthesis|nr:glycosyltransferase family 2 protein [Bacteroidales bacterium]
MEKGLVSIITPCYNTGHLIHRLLDSILNQDYTNIELFVMDDGSTDNSKEVIASYIPAFEEKGYSLTYVYQDNSGQSAAINNALKFVNGEFLVWPDSDDYYAYSNVISRFVQILENSDETTGMVRCLPSFIDEFTLKPLNNNYPLIQKYNDCLFEPCLFHEENFWFGAGDYMVKMNVLDKCISQRTIYTAKDAGQNWQLMLPVLYKYRCITISERLYNVLARNDSHSRGQYKTFEQQCIKFDTYEKTLLATIGSISKQFEVDLSHYEAQIKCKYGQIKLKLCVRYSKFKKYNYYLKKLKESKCDLTFPEKMKNIILLIIPYKVFLFLRRII